MKKLIAAGFSVLLLNAANAWSHEGGDFGKIVCIQNTEFSPIKGEKIMVLMEQIQKTRSYKIAVLQKQLGGERKVVLTDVLKVTTADVQANFRAKGSRVSVQIYMDELNQSTLYTSVGEVTMVCRTNRNKF